jgi:hypothetical protein
MIATIPRVTLCNFIESRYLRLRDGEKLVETDP